MTNQISLNNNVNFLSHLADPNFQTNIFNQADFKEAVAGIPAFFRHTKTFIQYGITEAQKIFHNTFHNVTHVGLILNATDQEICLAEAVREGVTTHCYSPQDLVKEDICFPLTEQANNPFLKGILKIAQEKMKTLMKYDLQGAIQQSFIPKMFTDAQKKELIERSLGHLLDGELTQTKNEYFCSEFVLETLQTATLNQIPLLQKLVNKTSDLINASFSRSELIQKIMNSLDIKSIWEKISGNPLFKAPSAAMSPADLFAMQAEISPIICVSPQDLDLSPCSSKLNQEGTECLEYLALRQIDRHLMGEIITVNDPSMQELIAELSKKTNYSEETLRCIFDKFQGDQDLPAEIDKCLIETLSYQEQIMIYLVSSALSAGVDRLEANPSLLDRFQSSNDTVVEEAAKEMFPINPLRSKHFLTNIYILLSLQNKDLRFVSKNMLLAILYDMSIAKKATAIGMEKIYPVFLEKMTTLDREVFQCIFNSCTNDPKTIISCSASCLQPEFSAASLIVKNIQKELDEIIKNPEAWLEDLVEENQNPLKECLTADFNQENLHPKITRTLKPNNPSSFRESLLPFAALVYYTNNPLRDLNKLQNALSHENAIKIINNKNIINKSIEKIAIKYISQKTLLDPTAIKCIIHDCELSLSHDDLEDCLDQCVEPTLPEHKKKEAIKEQLDSIVQEIEKKESALFDDENIGTINSLINSNIHDSLRAEIHNPGLISKFLELSKKEWEFKSIEEKLSLLMRIAYPKTYRILQLMNRENAKLAVEHFRIWNQIARYVKTQFRDGSVP